jgi:excisionase family DNA binding protein
MEKLLCSKKEASEALGVSVRTIENMIRGKQLSSRRVGGRRMIPCSALVQFARRGTPVITSKNRPFRDGLARDRAVGRGDMADADELGKKQALRAGDGRT